jgi:hypothetical protein
MAGINFALAENQGRSRTPLDEIGQVVIDTVEEMYAGAKGQRVQSDEFTDKGGAEKFLSDMRAYGYWRKDTTGRLLVTGNLAKGPGWSKDKETFVIRVTVDDFPAETPAESA